MDSQVPENVSVIKERLERVFESVKRCFADVLSLELEVSVYGVVCGGFSEFKVNLEDDFIATDFSVSTGKLDRFGLLLVQKDDIRVIFSNIIGMQISRESFELDAVARETIFELFGKIFLAVKEGSAGGRLTLRTENVSPLVGLENHAKHFQQEAMIRVVVSFAVTNQLNSEFFLFLPALLFPSVAAAKKTEDDQQKSPTEQASEKRGLEDKSLAFAARVSETGNVPQESLSDTLAARTEEASGLAAKTTVNVEAAPETEKTGPKQEPNGMSDSIGDRRANQGALYPSEGQPAGPPEQPRDNQGNRELTDESSTRHSFTDEHMGDDPSATTKSYNEVIDQVTSEEITATTANHAATPVDAPVADVQESTSGATFASAATMPDLRSEQATPFLADRQQDAARDEEFQSAAGRKPPGASHPDINPLVLTDEQQQHPKETGANLEPERPTLGADSASVSPAARKGDEQGVAESGDVTARESDARKIVDSSERESNERDLDADVEGGNNGSPQEKHQSVNLDPPERGLGTSVNERALPQREVAEAGIEKNGPDADSPQAFVESVGVERSTGGEPSSFMAHEDALPDQRPRKNPGTPETETHQTPAEATSFMNAAGLTERQTTRAGNKLGPPQYDDGGQDVSPDAIGGSHDGIKEDQKVAREVHEKAISNSQQAATSYQRAERKNNMESFENGSDAEGQVREFSPSTVNSRSPAAPPAARLVQNAAVKVPEFKSFGDAASDPSSDDLSNLPRVLSIPVEVSILLGTERKKIGEVLGFGKGTVIQLSKHAGSAVDVMVNGQQIAKGIVVVVDDNFAVRITEIARPRDLLGGL
ncbi:MAG: FliM/FliN family flagellar motor switch protein [Oscillospiraceae bacterium]|nr:FliM/FliN family flagellar motor switch protein [Oscillospiraceae bacterium]